MTESNSSIKMCVLHADTSAATIAAEEICERYTCYSVEESNLIVPLGGDGFMLECLHKYGSGNYKFFGMNLGTVGFLMNGYDIDMLDQRLANAETFSLRPLRMRVVTVDGEIHFGLGINEVSLFRETRQAANLSIEIDGIERLSMLVCDGVLISTPAGSTAYNLSAHGPIIPLGAELMALTPISAFRPRRWRGALLPSRARVKFTVNDPSKRPVSAVADYTEVRDVAHVEVWEDQDNALPLLFDSERNLAERIIAEQFQV